MTATIIDGKALGTKVREEVAASVAELGHVGLATVLVGDDPASHIYIDLKQKAAQQAGMEARDLKLPSRTSEEALLATIAELNADDAVDGLLVQLPLPDHIDENRVIEAIAPAKDVDGIHPINAGRLYLGRPSLVPGTPLGIMRMLDEYEIPLEGARAVVVGRSAIVGKPMAHLLLRRNATVTICHSRTRDLPSVTRQADILVVAIGRAGFIRSNHIKPGATVIDVGMNQVADEAVARSLFGDDLERRLQIIAKRGYTLVGDVNAAEADEIAGRRTPVPGGVGLLTVAMLMSNTLKAARLRRGLQDDQ